MKAISMRESVSLFDRIHDPDEPYIMIARVDATNIGVKIQGTDEDIHQMIRHLLNTVGGLKNVH